MKLAPISPKVETRRLHLGSRAPTGPLWSARLPLAVGLVAVVALVGGVGLWGVATRISGAVIAPGRVEVQSNRQVVEHPDGGVVGEIMVKDGDRVTAGQTLLRLDGTRTRSERAIVEGQLRDLAARRARLEVERDGAETIAFGAQLRDWAAQHPDYATQLSSEKTLFQARLQALRQQRDLLAEQNHQLGDRISGTEAELAAVREQQRLVSGQLADQTTLLEKGLTEASRVLDLKRQFAGLEGQVGQLVSQIADLKRQITANEIAALQLVTKRREEAVSQLRDIEAKQVELRERQLSLDDTLSRLEIRAPVGGVVYSSKVFAVHSVVRAADPLMYIIPQDQPLVVAARVDATHIDDIHLGQPVTLSFPSFDQRTTKPISGEIARISADVMADDTTHQNYYAVTVRTDARSLAAFGKGKKLIPGMPVEAFIQTESHSPLSYIMHPLTVYFSHSLRE